MIHQGGCVCESVRYVAHDDPERVTICHCAWCQRRTGSAFGIEVVFRLEKVTKKELAPKAGILLISCNNEEREKSCEC